QALCKMQSLGMGDGQRRSTQVPGEQAPQMAARDTQPLCEHFDVTLIEGSAGDQPQATAHRGGRTAPCRRAGSAFRPATKTRAIARLAGGRGAREVADILALR